MNTFLKFKNIYLLSQTCKPAIRQLSTTKNLDIKVALCGCSGGVGQPLALLLKLSPLVKELALYDIQKAPGIHADLSHINTRAKVNVYPSPDKLDDALEGKEIIIISAGQARKKGMKRKDLFKANADIIRGFVSNIIRVAPRAFICILTNPVNSVVPVAAAALKRGKVYDPKRLFGITTLDSVRVSTFLAEVLCLDSSRVYVPVVGGHSGETIVPLFSQAKPAADLPKDKIRFLTGRLQDAGTEVVRAKGDGSATLSTAFAAARFVTSLCRALKGESDVIESAYVQSDLTDAQFFATPLLLGSEGMKKNLGFGKLNDYECCLIDKAVKELIKDIKLADSYAKQDNKGS